MSTQPTTPASSGKKSILDWIEWVGNKLPEPALIFLILALAVVVVSAVGSAAGWKVSPKQPTTIKVPKLDAAGAPVLDEKGNPTLTNKLDERGKPIVILEPLHKPVFQTDAKGNFIYGKDNRPLPVIENGKPKEEYDAAGKPVPLEIEPRSLLTTDGVYWMITSMVRNFTGLPALGLVFVSMLGIGLAEKFGLFSALMRQLALLTPKAMLTPVILFIGANASVASDAGYIILPPLAAALYLAVGRHPVAGLAASFAGVAGGFGGGMFPTAADGFLAGVATSAAQIIDPTYAALQPTHNLYFKIASAVLITLAGWFVTDRIIEPRLMRAKATGEEAGTLHDMALTAQEKRGLLVAAVTFLVVLGGFLAMMLIPDAPLTGKGQPVLPDYTMGYPDQLMPAFREASSDRWSQAIVPMIFLCFLIPGMAFGYVTGALRTQKDFIDALYHGIKSIVPVLAIAFFMGQFVNYFTYTGLDRMLAYAGGSMLVEADLPIPLLITLFVLLVIAGDFAMSGMLSKFGVMAPIFIPMFMMVGISPELTTAAYRIGDSVVNIITPLNSYLLIILVVLQKYKKEAGLGSLISLMLPYSVVFGLLWTGFLLAWYYTGNDLGPNAALTYIPK